MSLLHAGEHHTFMPFTGAETLFALLVLGVVIAALAVRTDTTLHRVMVVGWGRLRRALPGAARESDAG